MNEETNDDTFASIAFRFASPSDAATAYERARDLIFGNDFNASAYRVLLNGRSHVVVICDGVPPARLEMALPEICVKGEMAAIPEEILVTLALRRASFSGSDVKFERRSGL
jgi:hypothetical protein